MILKSEVDTYYFHSSRDFLSDFVTLRNVRWSFNRSENFTIIVSKLNCLYLILKHIIMYLSHPFKNLNIYKLHRLFISDLCIKYRCFCAISELKLDSTQGTIIKLVSDPG